jgi:EmrB/QacA subfamily drug resistance transporter
MTTMVAKPPCDVGEVLGGTLSAPCAPNLGRWVLTATILGSSMAFIDSSAVNVALPALQSSLGSTVTQVQWVIEVYLLFLAALILVGGALGDRRGRRRVFMWGVGSFAVASLACGFAQDPTQLIIARALQGIGGALLVPGSLAIISASFSEADRGKAIGTWSGFTAITMAAGPVIGGWLVTELSWRWVFYINIPFALIVLLIAATRVPETRNESASGRIDWTGAGLSVAGLGLLVFGLIESANLGLMHPLALGSILAGLLVLAVFVWVERRVESPMMPLDVFRSRSFTGANLLTVLLYGALGGALFFLPFNLIQVQGYTPAQAGAAWLPFILTIAFLSRWTGALVPIVGPRLLLVVGPLLLPEYRNPDAGRFDFTSVFLSLAAVTGVQTTAPEANCAVTDIDGHDLYFSHGRKGDTTRPLRSMRPHCPPSYQLRSPSVTVLSKTSVQSVQTTATPSLNG